MWMKTCILQQFFVFLVILVEVLLITSSAGLENNEFGNRVEKKSCLQLLSKCRKNATCKSTYKYVKRKCTSISGRTCFASTEIMQNCADNIDWLRQQQFGEECQCDTTKHIKKIKSCFEAFNMLYANPCYDHGVKAREEKQSINSITTATVVTTGLYDVINRSSNSAFNAEKFLSLSNETEAEVDETKILNHRGGFELEPEHDTDQTILRSSEHLNFKHPEILRGFFPVDRDLLTQRGRGRPRLRAVNDGETPFENRFASSRNHQEFLQNNGSDFEIKKMFENELSSSNIPSLSDRFRDNANGNSVQMLSDPNAEEVAKVVAKYMGDYNEKDMYISPAGINTISNSHSTLNDVSLLTINTKAEDVLITQQQGLDETKSKRNDNNADDHHPQGADNVISLIVLVGTSFCLGLFVLIIVIGLCYRRWKTKGYISKIFEKKTCHHSAIIISSLYEDRNIRLSQSPENV